MSGDLTVKKMRKLKKSVIYTVTYPDGSHRDFDIRLKFAPLVDDLLYRLEKLQKYGTTVYEKEKEIYHES